MKQAKRLRELVVRRDGIACFWCGVLTVKPPPGRGFPQPDRTRTIDHIVPVSAGGTHHADNLVLACRACNCRRKNIAAEQWLAMTLPNRVKMTRGQQLACAMTILLEAEGI